jgi:ABC-type lipoprotein export system ATPase subunit
LRALANDPEILLADEPTGNLYCVNSARIMEILVGIQKQGGMTLIEVTHKNDIAHSAARQICFRDGKIEATRTGPGVRSNGVPALVQ